MLLYPELCLLIGPSPVRDLTVTPFGVMTLSVSWRRPIASGSAGGLVSYKISYKISQDGGLLVTVNDTVTEYNITLLDPDTNYEIKVCV